MHARSTTVRARLESIDDGIAQIRDVVMPALMDMQGCIGLSLIVDRGTGRCIATSAWDSEESMRASESRVQSVRNDAATAFGGTVEAVEEWQIGALHRAHQASEGACVRCTWLQADPATVDSALDAFRTSILPAVEAVDGFCSASMFIDRATGRAVAATAWDSHDAMARSRDQMNQVRSSVAGQLGAEVLEVAEFELVLAHLRVPEMA